MLLAADRSGSGRELSETPRAGPRSRMMGISREDRVGVASRARVSKSSSRETPALEHKKRLRQPSDQRRFPGYSAEL